MIVLDFSHPLTPEQREQIETLARQDVERVIDVPTQFDHSAPFGEQAAALVGSVGLEPAEWQRLPLLVIPPAFPPGTAAVLAYLHGLMGHWPSIARLRPVPGAVPSRFEVSEIVDLAAVRDAGRGARSTRAQR